MKVQEAESTDYEDLLELFPRLAAFDLPQNRNPDHLWGGDAEILKDWAAGNRDDCLVHVAKNEAGKVLGVAMVTMRPELLSHAPSAHLEALAVAEKAEGQGVGSALLASVEEDAQQRGALSMSLTVFARNQRARKVYERAGYDGELLRYIKPFSGSALN
jgi:ribosomal protein S18 acetylase RimI-like enzyme